MARKIRKEFELPKETLAPPRTAEREAQILRLMKAAGGNAAIVGRAVGLTKERVAQLLVEMAPKAKAAFEKRCAKRAAAARKKKLAQLEELQRELGEAVKATVREEAP